MSGRKFLLALSIGVVLVFSLALKFFGEKAVWGALDIHTQHPAFIDLRGVLTGLDAARLGFDPIHENPLDLSKGRLSIRGCGWLWAGLGFQKSIPKFWLSGCWRCMRFQYCWQ